MNRSAVVKILQRREVCSRADVARQTGLSQAAITKIVNALIEMGIVAEVGPIKGQGKRRSFGLKLNADKHLVVGVKFARQTSAVGVFDISGRIYSIEERKHSPDEDRATVLTALKNQVRDLISKYKNVVAVGLAVPGPYLRDEGRTALLTRLPMWHNVNFIKEFKEGFEKPVFIEHDANAAALAEWWFGDHTRPIHTLAYFLVGEGVGSGIIERGNLMLGSLGSAGEIGHVSIDYNGPKCECGNFGCLELYCSSSALMDMTRRHAPECLPAVLPQSHKACSIVFNAAREGNKKAMEVVKRIAGYIGVVCVTIINAYNPEIIVIGDSLSRGGDLLLPTINDIVRQRVVPELHSKVQIKITNLRIDPTLYGAAAIATDKVLQLPSAFSESGGKRMGAMQK
jgi:predicted NBD/HSP70 family sugar kinase